MDGRPTPRRSTSTDSHCDGRTTRSAHVAKRERNRNLPGLKSQMQHGRELIHRSILRESVREYDKHLGRRPRHAALPANTYYSAQLTNGHSVVLLPKGRGHKGIDDNVDKPRCGARPYEQL
jgi:hypothetical protein